MPVSRFGVGLDGAADFLSNCILWSNALYTAREWWESVISTGALYQDRLTFQDAVTGMPTQLPAGIQCETVFNCRSKPQQWTARWDGQGTVVLRFQNGNQTAATFSSSSGAFTFAHDGSATLGRLFITATTVGNQVRNLWVGPVSELTSPTGLSARFRNAMMALRPPVVRAMDLMGPNQLNGSTVVNWADVRPAGWWTQSNIALDVFAVTVGAWSGAAPQLGDIVDFVDGGVVGWGTVVRVGSPVAGAWGHIKLGSGGIPTNGMVLRQRTTLSQATLSADGRVWEPITRGPAIVKLRDIAAFLYSQCGTHTFWLAWSITATLAFHTQAAREWRDDPRLVGQKVANELSNERWNTAAGYAREWNYQNDQGVADNMPGSAAWEKGAQWGALRQHNIHETWKTEYGARAAEVVRVFGGHNMSGEFWYRQNTIINPDNDPAYLPAWPRQELPIDAWAVAPYPGQLDQQIYERAGAWTGTPQVGEQVWNGLSGGAERRGTYIGRFGTSVVIELNVAPYTAFDVGNTVTGVTSAASFVIASGGWATDWSATATDQQLSDYLTEIEIPRHITNTDVGTEPYRSGGLHAHRLFCNQRGCALWCYEWNTHFVPYTNERYTTHERFHLSPQYDAAFRTIAAEIASRADEGCFYAMSRPRGVSGFWDLIESFDTQDRAQGVRFGILTEELQNEIELRYNDADAFMWSPPCSFEVIPPEPQTIDLASEGSLVTEAATASTFEVVPPTDVELSTIGAVVRDAATPSVLEVIGSDETYMVTERSLVFDAAAESVLEVIPPSAFIVELWTAWSCTTMGADPTDWDDNVVDLRSEPADLPIVAEAGDTRMSFSPADGEGRTLTMWQAGADMWGRKAQGATIGRASLLSYEIDTDRFYAPLRAGKPFGGISLEHSPARTTTVRLSRTGTIVVDFEGDAALGDTFVAVAISDQRILTEQHAIGLRRSYTRIGNGRVTSPGIATIDYRAEGFS